MQQPGNILRAVIKALSTSELAEEEGIISSFIDFWIGTRKIVKRRRGEGKLG